MFPSEPLSLTVNSNKTESIIGNNNVLYLPFQHLDRYHLDYRFDESLHTSTAFLLYKFKLKRMLMML